MTFLFTDLEESTRRWEANPSATEALVAAHDKLVRTVVERHNGYIFATMGDGFGVAFHRASDAVAAAAELQEWLSQEEWASRGVRVRMGVHTGEAVERDGDYFGSTVNRTARIMGLAHGGQILLSAVTAGLVEGVDTVELGEYQLRGLSRPERLYQVVKAGLRQDFPPLRGERGPLHNLPAALTSFVGRQAEIDTVSARVGEGRLVTLVGPGGMGKTRLALEVARRVLDEFPDGVWWAELAPVRDPGQVGPTVAQAIGQRDPLAETEPAKRVQDRLGAAIGRSLMLLLLDNCEHLVGPTAELVADLLAVCPRLVVVATSRQSLGVPGERLFEVGSLDTPADDDAASVAASGAGCLFVERADAVLPGFRLDDTTAPAVAQLCRRLEGMPLAIELAAARARIFTPGQLADRLEEALGVLSGGHGRLERHHTMRAALVWSYELLSEAEQALFRSLGVLRSSVILEAVEAVAPSVVGDVSSILEGLIDKSLVVVVDGVGPDRRYGLRELVRQFAAEMLRSDGEYDDAARRHRDFFLSRVQIELADDVGRPAYAGMAPEIDNVRAAIEHSLRISDNAAAIELMCAARAWWRHLGLFGEELQLLQTALRAAEPAELPALAHSRALNEAASATIYLGRVNESTRFCEKAGELSDLHPDSPELRAGCAFQAAMLDYYAANGDPARGNRLMRESQTLHDASGHSLAAAYALGGLIRAAIFHDRVDDPDVDQAISDGLERARIAQAPLAELTVQVLGSMARLLRGSADGYRDCLDAFAELDRLGSGWFPEMCAQLVGLAAEATDETPLAREQTLRYIRSCRQSGIRLMLPCAIRSTARLASRGLPDVALSLWGGAEQMEAATGLRNLPLMERLDAPIRQACAAGLPTRAEKLVMQGAAWSTTQVTEVAEEALLTLPPEPPG